MMTVLTLWDTLESIRQTALREDLAGVMDIAGILACMMTAGAILKVVRTYMTGTNIDPWDLFRPLILMLVVCNFNTIVLRPVDALTSIVSRETAEVFDMSPNEYVLQWGENMIDIGDYVHKEHQRAYEEELRAIAEDQSVIGAFFSKLWIGCKKFLKDFFSVGTLTIAGLIGGILFLIVKILLFAQQILSAIFLLINSLFGPFILAMSILPGYESGFRNWFSRHFQLSMWVPIGNMVMGLNLHISNCFVEFASRGDAGLSLEWLMIVLQILAMVSILSVPKFATWIAQGAGSDDAHGSISQIAKKAVKL